MTKYAEVIYETGSKSIVSFDDLDKLKGALIEQQRRAKSGVPGGPAGHAGERVKRVLLYNDHPGDLNEDCLLNAQDALQAVSDAPNVDGKVSVWDIISGLRSQLSPMTPRDETGPHDSNYVMKEYDELDMEWLDWDPNDLESTQGVNVKWEQ